MPNVTTNSRTSHSESWIVCPLIFNRIDHCMIDYDVICSGWTHCFNYFHYCASHMLEPLKSARETCILMSSGEGVTCQVFPIFVCFIGNYPEQVLVSGCKTGDCPRCPTKQVDLGQLEDITNFGTLGKSWRHYQHLSVILADMHPSVLTLGSSQLSIHFGKHSHILTYIW